MSCDRVALANLRAGSANSAVYWTVRSAGRGGIGRAATYAALTPRLSHKTVDGCLHRLMMSGLIVQPLGRGTPFLVDDSCGARVGDTFMLATAGTVMLDMIADCDVGISVSVLAEETGLVEAEVHAALLDALAGGQVERVRFERRHGGMGYRTPQHLLAQWAQALKARLVAAGEPENITVVVGAHQLSQPARPMQMPGGQP